MFANTSLRRVLAVFVVLVSALGGGSAFAGTCHTPDDQAGPFFLIQDPGALAHDVPARVGIRATNPGPTTWFGEGNLPHPFRLGVGGDPDQAGDVIWSGWDCGGYSDPLNPLKNQRAYMCNTSNLPREVGPNETVDFFFNVTVPANFTGSQAALRLRMVYDAGTECDGWIGAQVVHNFDVCSNAVLPDPSDRWLLEIWNGRQPQVGDPVERRYDYVGDNGFDFPSPTGPASKCLPSPNDYSVRFVRSANFPQEGTYRFNYTTDDGMRIYIDNTLVADRWADPQVITDSFERFMTAGSHSIEVLYYQAMGGAHAALSWTFETGPPPVRPPPPTDLVATGLTSQIALGWTASTGAGITGYNVKRRPPSGTFAGINCSFSDATHCIDSGLPAGTDFCYVVTAVNAAGESDPSNEACARTNGGPPPPVRPPAPTDLAATGLANQIALGWTASTGSGITGYNVKRRPPSGTFEGINCAFSDPTHCTDNGLPAATDFCYVVTAVNAAGESDPSNEACARTNDGPPPPVRPPAPTGLTATGGTDAVLLGWNASPDASVTHYNVKRRIPPDLSYGMITCNFTDPVHCTDTDVVPGTTYCYVVTAVSPGGESDNSNEACANPTAAAQPSIQLSVADASGFPVTDGTTLGTTPEGWPTPNGLVVTATVSCPTNQVGGCRGNGVFLELHYTGQSARFWIESRDPLCRGIDNTTVSDYSFAEALWLCNNAPNPGLDLSPGQSKQLLFSVMVQPNATPDVLQMNGTWGAANDQFTIGNPATQIHPMVLIPGILGTMPPSVVIGQMDPVLGVYNPMQIHLQKMGYVMDQSLFPMPYDWRRSNRETAGHLRDRLDTVFSKIQGIPVVMNDGKADLVVHSMGGLITRTYVEGLAVDPTTLAPIAYRNDIRKVVFMSTPHRGFPENYRTYEGSTWDMFLYDDTLPAFAMDNVFWPAFVEKRWAKRHTLNFDYLAFPPGHPFAGRVMCLFGPLDCTGFFSPTVEYRMTHDLVGGTDSLRQMLPTDDSDAFFGPYLCHNATGGPCAAGPYPFGKQTNPLLNPPLLNDAANLSLLETRLGAANIYVIYGRDPDPARPQDLVDVTYDVSPPISLLGTKLYQNGVPRLAQRVAEGDDLIPDYSMDLKLLLPSIPADNVAGTFGPGGKIFGLQGDAARHKQIMYNPEVLNFWLPKYLAGLDRLSLHTEYVKPIFVLDPHQWWNLAALCPVNLTVMDPQGRRAGYNPDTGGVFNEIPGAVYAAPNSPDGQFLILPDPVGGDYEISAAGFDKDSFSLVLSQITGKGVFRRWSAGGQTQPGQVDRFTVHFDPTPPTAQHLPTADAGPDQTVAAGDNCQATVMLDGSRSGDADGEDLTYIWTGAPFGAGAVVGVNPTVTLPVGTHTLTLLVQDGSRTTTSDTVVVTVTAPTPNIKSLTASPSVLDRPDGKFVDVTVTPELAAGCSVGATCRIVSVTSDEPVGDGGDWQITGPLTVKLRAKRDRGGDGRVYTITVECRFGNGPASRKAVTVTVPPAGRMTGEGEIEKGEVEYEYSFDVSESERGIEGGKLKFEVEREEDEHEREDELRSIEITSVVFSNDGNLDPGGSVLVDTVRFAGKGKWNGKEGYTFEVTATDAGEPGKGHDRFKIVVRDKKGNTVASVDDKIDSGNNQSKPAPK